MTASPSNGDDSRVTLAIAIRPALWGEALQRLLEQDGAYDVLARVHNEEALQQVLKATPPILVLFDYEALGPGSEGTIARLRRAFPAVRFLVLSSRTGDDTTVALLRAGAAGVVPKEGEFATLLSAIQAVCAGQTWANRRVTARALSELSSPYSNTPTIYDVHLTRREMDVVDGVSRGLRNREIALNLGISEKTVKTHLNNVFGKLGIHSRTALARWALDRLGTKN